VKRGELSWEKVDAWRQQLHRDFEQALAETKLPERPDYEAANALLVEARSKKSQGVVQRMIPVAERGPSP
jgi:hypothetical protein